MLGIFKKKDIEMSSNDKELIDKTLDTIRNSNCSTKMKYYSGQHLTNNDAYRTIYFDNFNIEFFNKTCLIHEGSILIERIKINEKYKSKLLEVFSEVKAKEEGKELKKIQNSRKKFKELISKK